MPTLTRLVDSLPVGDALTSSAKNVLLRLAMDVNAADVCLRARYIASIRG
jgi:hypothetical protein